MPIPTIMTELPETISVPVPAAGKTYEFNLTDVSADQLLAALIHGLKQRIGDAAAGQTDKVSACDAAAEKVWSIGGGTRGPKADPVMVEARAMIVTAFRAKGKPTKVIPSKMAEFADWFVETFSPGQQATVLDKARANVAARTIDIAL
jgi:hypothetical protein